MREAIVRKGLSILMPHHSTPLNDEALDLNIAMLKENTTSGPFEILLAREYGDPYRFWNDISDRAKYECLAFTCSDMLMAPGWDVAMMAHLDGESIVTGYLVEPGVIPVASKNITIDFGRTPGRFRRSEFEAYCSSLSVPEVRDGFGWYMPLMVTKGLFSRMGKYPSEQPFPHPNDLLFWEKATRAGVAFRQVRSFAYHFQNLSNPIHDAKRS